MTHPNIGAARSAPTSTCLIAGALAASCLIAAARPALGQAAGGAQELAPLTITAPAPSPVHPNAADARLQIERTPGAVDVVEAEEFIESRAITIKDMLDYTPGVFAQPKFGEDSRLSIRGSGLSRNFHLRGVKLLQDGVLPINTADGGGDFQEIDPLALSYVEVYKGANALRYGASSLGGAINFVTPTGRDLPRAFARAGYGSFDTYRLQLGSGGVHGDWDYAISGAYLASKGFRDHSAQDSRRLSTNLGYRFGDSAETRFYLNLNDIDQELPGSVSKRQALSDPKAATASAIAGDQARDIDSVRVANKTAFFIGDVETTVGAFYFDRRLDHPIFQVLDNHYRDYGGFLRGAGEFDLAGHGNRFVLGANLHAGDTDARRFVNNNSRKGALTADQDEQALNVDLYGENAFFVTPAFSVVLGAQFNYAERETTDNFLADGDGSVDQTYTSLNPKIGFVWEPGPSWQVFGNVSRSSEVPTFSELSPTAQTAFAALDPQKAITAEIGTRGRMGRVGWDVAAYRAWIRDELQLFDAGNGATFALNAERTIHQGVEIGLDASVVQGLFEAGAAPDDLWLRTAYTFSDFRFDDDDAFGDNELPGAPRHYLRAELLYRHPAGFFVGPNVEWVPEAYYVDNANTLDTKPYALLGARAGYDFGFGSVYVDARNLTDEKYISNANVTPVATANSALFNPGDGAGVFVGAEIRW